MLSQSVARFSMLVFLIFIVCCKKHGDYKKEVNKYRHYCNGMDSTFMKCNPKGNCAWNNESMDSQLKNFNPNLPLCGIYEKAPLYMLYGHIQWYRHGLDTQFINDYHNFALMQAEQCKSFQMLDTNRSVFEFYQRLLDKKCYTVFRENASNINIVREKVNFEKLVINDPLVPIEIKFLQNPKFKQNLIDSLMSRRMGFDRADWIFNIGDSLVKEFTMRFQICKYGSAQDNNNNYNIWPVWRTDLSEYLKLFSKKTNKNAKNNWDFIGRIRNYDQCKVIQKEKGYDRLAFDICECYDHNNYHLSDSSLIKFHPYVDKK